jgi:hypothetical protein
MRGVKHVGRRLQVVLPLAGVLIALLPGGALAAQRDVAATRAYVQANERLVRAGWERIARDEAALRSLRLQVSRSCPLAAANSPQDPESTQLSDEVIGAMVTAVVRLDPSAARQFVRGAASLAWSSQALTRQVRAYVHKVGVLASLAPPRLCSDVESWASSGFRALPSSTTAFVANFMPAWVALGELPSGLARFETADEQPALRRSRSYEEAFTDFESQEVETWGQIMNELDLWP